MSEAAFEIVPFDPVHEKRVLALAEAVLCGEYGAVRDLSGEADLRDIGEAYGPPDGRFLVAMSLGEVVATGGVRRLEGRDCELMRLYVRSDMRRQGLASAMVGELLPFVKERGYKRLLVELLPIMESKSKIYARYGFAHVAEAQSPRPGKFMAIHL